MQRQKSFQNEKATLYLVATPIGNLSEFSPRAISTLKEVDYIACEDTRVTKTLLERFLIKGKLLAYHNFNERESSEGLIALLKEGHDIALLSDAGYPLVSDPGFDIVNKTIANGFNVVTISGPSAGLHALIASGMDVRHYLFYGFLNERTSKAKSELESLMTFPYTMIFYEAPHRITNTLKLMYEVLGDRKVCIARELTKIHEEYIRGTLKEVLGLDDLKGEIVIIVEGDNKEKVIDYSAINILIEEMIKEGVSTKDAIKEVSKVHGLSKNEVYRQYLAQKDQGF